MSCKKDDLGGLIVGSSISKKLDNPYIIRSRSHLAFPDLIKYNKKWYVAFREGDGHLYANYSKIIVMASSDFDKWEKISEIEIPNWDLRDAKFSYDNIKNKLYLHYYARHIQSPYFVNKQYYREFDNLKENFENEKEFLRATGRWQNDWYWKPYWYEGNIYTHGYLSTGIRTYKSNKLDNYPNILSEYNVAGWSEAASEIVNDTIYTIIRTNEQAKFGKSSLNKIDYQIIDMPIDNFGGPNIKHFKEGKFLLAGREGLYFNIFLYDSNSQDLQVIYSKKTMNQDNAYNGIVLENNKLYGVFYHQLPSGEFTIEKLILDLSKYE